MGVIINELDVVAAPTADPGGVAPAGREAAPPPPPPALSVEELRNLLRHQAGRVARLRAH